jgi:hypothetical protein
MSKELPKNIAVFPLSGALLLPKGHLPLNIFEPRYLNMIEDALQEDRIIGMIQPRADVQGSEDAAPLLYDVGCLGKITSFHETEDGRYMISLTGITRFKATKETKCARGYRRMDIDTARYKDDLDGHESIDEHDNLDWTFLYKKLDHYFKRHELDCDVEVFDEVPKSRLLTILSMICPFEPSEKQALLEADCMAERLKLFTKIINIAVQCDEGGSHSTCH